MDPNRQIKRGYGRGALLQRLAANAAASSSSTSDESRSGNVSSATSTESLLDRPTTTENSTGSGSSLNCSVSSTEPDDTGYDSKSAKSSGRSQGRGQLLQRMLLAQQSISNEPVILASEPKPFGMGRGRMLKALAELNREEQKVEESVPCVEDTLDNLSLGSAEAEPVIKRGTSG